MLDVFTGFLGATPPRVAVLLGFFMGLALKRARIEAVLDRVLPTPDVQEDGRDG